jgi:hypothetical protein
VRESKRLGKESRGKRAEVEKESKKKRTEQAGQRLEEGSKGKKARLIPCGRFACPSVSLRVSELNGELVFSEIRTMTDSR